MTKAPWVLFGISIPVVWWWELWITLIYVTLIFYMKVMTCSSKFWTMTAITANGILSIILWKDHFLLQSQRKKKAFLRIIVLLTLTNWIPFIFGKSSNIFIKICSNKNQSILDIVTFLVEHLGPEPFGRPSVDCYQLLWVVEGLQ